MPSIGVIMNSQDLSHCMETAATILENSLSFSHKMKPSLAYVSAILVPETYSGRAFAREQEEMGAGICRVLVTIAQIWRRILKWDGPLNRLWYLHTLESSRPF